MKSKLIFISVFLFFTTYLVENAFSQESFKIDTESDVRSVSVRSYKITDSCGVEILSDDVWKLYNRSADYFFNENKYLIKEVKYLANKNVKNTYLYSYNEDNNVTKITKLDSSNSLLSIEVFEYNDKKQIISSILYSSEDYNDENIKKKVIYQYNDFGNLLQKTGLNTTFEFNTYDAQNRLICKVTRKEDATLLDSTTYSYDANSNLKVETSYGENLISKVKYRYNSQNQLKLYSYNSKEYKKRLFRRNITYIKFKHKYNSNGDVLETKIKEKRGGARRKNRIRRAINEYKYNEQGKLIETKEFNFYDHYSISYNMFQIKYNSKGDIVERHDIRNNIIHKKEYEYID
ncbi:MAG: hypothetical protein ACOXZK_08665 [Bacteroidales bacterium]